MAKSFAEAKSALDEVLRLYKWRRHAKGFPEEAYLLLSRCAYVCYSLWRADEENQRDFFRRSPPPLVFWVGLNFDELRGSERQGTGSPADGHEAGLTNDTKWFAFWMKALEQSDPRGAPMCQAFARHILACVGHRNLLDAKTHYRSRKTLDFFLKGNEAGGVLLRTVAVLEDFIQAILRYFSTLDGRTCVLEKIALLTGLLGEMRQTIVWEAPASGPYSPSDDAHWRARSPLTWLSRDRTPGVLTVIPKREGGEIICICSPASNPKDRRASWVRQVTSLKGTYEEALFATWSYDTGEHRKNPQQFPGITAHWTVQYAEAQRLETLSRQVDLLLAALQGNPQCRHMVEVVRGILRNGCLRWKNTVLPWIYIKQLDELLAKLISVFRTASTSGGDGIAGRVVAQNWACEETTAAGAGPDHEPNGPGGPASPEVASQDMALALGEVKYVLPKANPAVLDKPEPSSGSCAQSPPGPSMQDNPPAVQGPEAEAQTRVDERPGEPESPREDSAAADPAPVCGENPVSIVSDAVSLVTQQPPAEVADSTSPPETDAAPTVVRASPEEPAPQPACVERLVDKSHGDELAAAGPAPVCPENPVPLVSDASSPVTPQPPAEVADSTSPPETDAAPTAVPASPEEPAPQPARVKSPVEKGRGDEPAGALLLRLLQHHAAPGGTSNDAALSTAELQRDLGWTPSQIQRAMTSIFGPKPFGAYKKKCEDRTIVAFLNERAMGVRESAYQKKQGLVL